MKCNTFFDFHVSSNAISTLIQCGYSGCVVFEDIDNADRGDITITDTSKSSGAIDTLCTTSHTTVSDKNLDFSVSKGIEIHAKNESVLRKLVGNARKHVDVIAVYGGSESLNRAACKNSNVDILVHPETNKDGGINHVIAKEARDHGVAIEFDLSRLIFLRGSSRMKAISDFKVNLMLARKYDVDIVLVSNAKTPYDVRMPRELVALAGLFGMHPDEACRAMYDVSQRIFKEQSSGYIADGIEVIE